MLIAGIFISTRKMTKSKRKTLKVKQSGADLSSGPRSQIQRSKDPKPKTALGG